MRRPIIIALTTALIVSMATFYSDLLKLDPASALARKAVDVALPELEARGLDKDQYMAGIYTRNSSVYVIFQRRDLLTEEDDDQDPLSLSRSRLAVMRVMQLNRTSRSKGWIYVVSPPEIHISEESAVDVPSSRAQIRGHRLPPE